MCDNDLKKVRNVFWVEVVRMILYTTRSQEAFVGVARMRSLLSQINRLAYSASKAS